MADERSFCSALLLKNEVVTVEMKNRQKMRKVDAPTAIQQTPFCQFIFFRIGEYTKGEWESFYSRNN
jgi:hypothetical protein